MAEATQEQTVGKEEEQDRKVALITGITGQDGSYLAEFLLEKVSISFIDINKLCFYEFLCNHEAFQRLGSFYLFIIIFFISLFFSFSLCTTNDKNNEYQQRGILCMVLSVDLHHSTHPVLTISTETGTILV